VDHGKSTLADRLLELTNTIGSGGKSQVLDKLQVERERGITVKAQTATLLHTHEDRPYVLNLIDTPGATSRPPHAWAAPRAPLSVEWLCAKAVHATGR